MVMCKGGTYMKRKILVVIAAALMIWMYPATAQTGTTPEK
jgi:hypothetical protein